MAMVSTPTKIDDAFLLAKQIIEEVIVKAIAAAKDPIEWRKKAEELFDY